MPSSPFPPPSQSSQEPDDYDSESLSVEAARQRISGDIQPISAIESVSLRSALGRVLAAPIISPFNLPNHDNSAMDGYAFRSEDVEPTPPPPLRIIGTAAAGTPYLGHIEPGTCIRIMTGAVLPSGADCVVEQERVAIHDNHITFSAPVKSGMNCRRAGEDLQAGQTALATGKLITPADLGLIASLGQTEVRVFRKLRVAFFSTGNELTPVGAALEPGQIYDSNRYTLYGMLLQLGVDLLDLGIVRDDPALLESTLQSAAANADVIITSGGVSVGEADHMKALLKKLGRIGFWKLAMKPGRPLAYGRIQQAHYFGLPGNPVAVMVTFYQFVREALQRLMGQATPPLIPLLLAECTAELRKRPGRTEFQRGTLQLTSDGTWKVQPFHSQGSGILRSMADANCFIVLPEAQANVPAGSPVQVQPFHGIL